MSLRYESLRGRISVVNGFSISLHSIWIPYYLRALLLPDLSPAAHSRRVAPHWQAAVCQGKTCPWRLSTGQQRHPFYLTVLP